MLKSKMVGVLGGITALLAVVLFMISVAPLVLLAGLHLLGLPVTLCWSHYFGALLVAVVLAK
jgi:hypothetical protein